MIDGANAGGQEQPFRSVNRDSGVQNDRARHHQRVAVALLAVADRVGAAGERGELPRRQRRGHGDGAHAWWLHRRAHGISVGGDGRGESVQLIGVGNVVAQAQPHHFRRVRHRSAAHRDNRVRPSRACFVGCRNDVDTRRVRTDFGEHAGQAVAKHVTNLVDYAGFAGQGAAGHDVNGAGVEALYFVGQRFGQGDAVDDAVDGWVAMDAANHFSYPFLAQKAFSAAASFPSPARSAAIRS